MFKPFVSLLSGHASYILVFILFFEFELFIQILNFTYIFINNFLLTCLFTLFVFIDYSVRQ